MVLNDQTIKRLDETINPRLDIFLKRGDVLVQRSNTLELVGTTAVFDGPTDEYVYPDLMMRLRFRAQETAHWFWRYANSSGGRRFFVGAAAGSTGTMPKLSGVALRNMPLPFPPAPEQRAITDVLSDVDALLGGLDRLIAKKRDLKQATMQQLLIAQTRLPGFHGAWDVKKLGKVADIDPENLSSDTTSEFQFNYISLEDVARGRLETHSEQVFQAAPSRARRILRDEDVLVSTVRPNRLSHLLFYGNGQPWVCSTGFSVVRCRAGVTHSGYVFFHMFGRWVNRQIEALLTGSNYPAINSGDVWNLEIPFPDYDEQTAIAEVLADMDAEIVALEQRREKTRALKQAIMQELLTGKTRLI
jgi:type I restriction enzyme S subunit